MVENIKKLVSEMDIKSVFVLEVSNYYGGGYDYINQVWFQKDWKIPSDKIGKIVEMAQNFVVAQNKRKEQVLRETGYKFEKTKKI